VLPQPVGVVGADGERRPQPPPPSAGPLQGCDILTNCRQCPRDEAPAAYKDFDEVLRSVELAGLASEVARLKARFVIKDAEGNSHNF
jgi:hypothetical protein